MVLSVYLTAAPAQTADRIVRERIEWCDIWIPSADESKLPRVLLIGDSITRGYYPRVEQGLTGKASVARLTTSKSLGDPALLAEVEMVLKQYPWDVIHFNNGMHGWGYTEQEYGAAFPKLVALLRKDAPKAKLIWANTTPVRVSGKLDQIEARTDRVKVRNRITAEIAAKEKIPVDDLFSLLENRPEFYSQDGVHSNGAGIEAEGAQVVASVTPLLPAK
jgi:lysophospholipase L1-like esterase